MKGRYFQNSADPYAHGDVARLCPLLGVWRIESLKKLQKKEFYTGERIGSIGGGNYEMLKNRQI